MSTVLGYRYAVEWGNPYTQPPDGKRVKMEWFETIEARRRRREQGDYHIPRIVLDAHQFGSGYAITVSSLSPPPRAKDAESRAHLRRKRLEKRMREKHPLFADQFIEEELQKRGWYYEGQEDPRYAEGRRQALDAYVQLYLRFYEFVLEHEGEQSARRIAEAAAWLFEDGEQSYQVSDPDGKSEPETFLR